MLIGIEYVVVAYVIWLFTFVCYIFLTKRRLKITNRAVAALEEKFTESSTHSMTAKNK
jgi:hypothetical protein